MSFFRDLRVAFHSLMRSKGLATIVILTLALGIGANAAIFTLVRGVLLKPLVNRDENRLMYIRQSAPSWEPTTPHSPCPKSRTSKPASTP
jgi:putative ABC transport system permease protein